MEGKRVKHKWLLINVLALLLLVSLACKSITNPTIVATLAPTEDSVSEPIATIIPTDTSIPPTATEAPSATITPTDTLAPPTETSDPNLIQPGIYIVGKDIQPGIYRGEAGTDLLATCYWACLKDLSGDFLSLLANDNAMGQFYVQINESDFALKTACELIPLSSLPEHEGDYPHTIRPGTYIVGRDIQPGTYKGQAGTDILSTCYWARLKDLSGDLLSLIANDNAMGQFYIQVSDSDFALKTACELELSQSEPLANIILTKTPSWTPTSTQSPTLTLSFTSTSAYAQSSTSTSPLPKVTPLTTKTPTPAILLSTPTTVQYPNLIVDSSVILDSHVSEVEKLLGNPTEIVAMGIGGILEIPDGCEERTYQVGKYTIDVYYNKTGIAKVLQIVDGLRDDEYSLDQYPEILDRVGVNFPGGLPDVVAPMALYWTNAFGYAISIFADGYIVWSVKIYKI